MEATTIKLEPAVKSDLEELRAELEADLERRVSFSQVVARLVKMARTRPFAWWGADQESTWTDDMVREWLAGADPVTETDSSNYKDVLYGDEA